MAFAITTLVGTKGAPSIGYAVVFIILGVATLGAGTLMSTNDVVVSATTIRSAGPPRRKVRVEDVESIDIVRRDFGKLLRVVPLMKMKDGKSIPLTPLAWSPRTPTKSLSLERQEEIVTEIRGLLSVGGVNYAKP